MPIKGNRSSEADDHVVLCSKEKADLELCLCEKGESSHSEIQKLLNFFLHLSEMSQEEIS